MRLFCHFASQAVAWNLSYNWNFNQCLMRQAHSFKPFLISNKITLNFSRFSFLGFYQQNWKTHSPQYPTFMLSWHKFHKINRHWRTSCDGVWEQTPEDSILTYDSGTNRRILKITHSGFRALHARFAPPVRHLEAQDTSVMWQMHTELCGKKWMKPRGLLQTLLRRRVP